MERYIHNKIHIHILKEIIRIMPVSNVPKLGYASDTTEYTKINLARCHFTKARSASWIIKWLLHQV